MLCSRLALGAYCSVVPLCFVAYVSGDLVRVFYLPPRPHDKDAALLGTLRHDR